jgi:hypothetical protein
MKHFLFFKELSYSIYLLINCEIFFNAILFAKMSVCLMELLGECSLLSLRMVTIRFTSFARVGHCFVGLFFIIRLRSSNQVHFVCLFFSLERENVGFHGSWIFNIDFAFFKFDKWVLYIST